MGINAPSGWGRGRAASFGTESRGAQSLHTWVFSERGGTKEKQREAAGCPKYLIFNRRQQTSQLSELGHHVDQVGFTRHLGHEDKRAQEQQSLSASYWEELHWRGPARHLCPATQEYCHFADGPFCRLGSQLSRNYLNTISKLSWPKYQPSFLLPSKPASP